MISQEHVHERPQREQTSSSMEEKQKPTLVKEQHTPPSASWWRDKKLFLRILGVLVPILGGFLIFAFPLSMHQPPFQTNAEMMLMTGVLGFYGADRKSVV